MMHLKNGFTIKTGNQDGLLDWMFKQHAKAYTKNWGLGDEFAHIVKRDMISFLGSYNSENSQIWVLMKGDQIFGSITCDGSKAETEGSSASLVYG